MRKKQVVRCRVFMQRLVIERRLDGARLNSGSANYLVDLAGLIFR